LIISDGDDDESTRSYLPFFSDGYYRTRA
jgi:hypothetical protein